MRRSHAPLLAGGRRARRSGGSPARVAAHEVASGFWRGAARRTQRAAACEGIVGALR
jgi:hypothetical protein